MTDRLSPIDLAIVAAYLVAITVFGLRFSRRNKVEGKSLKSYFLADNTIPWWAIALSIVSAETSTLTIVSIPGVAFAGDFGFLQIVLGYMCGRVVVALLFLPKYFKGEMLTAYQLIDRRFGHALHKVTAGLFLLTRAAAEGVRVFAISIVVGIAIDVGDIKAIAIISALTLLYTFEGGMAAVIWTDVVQMALYVAGTLVALWTLGAHVPGGWATIHTVGEHAAKFHWLNFSLNLTQSYTFWAGVLGGTFLTMASHGTDQLMVQRMLAARNLRESRLALLSSGVVIFVQFALFLLIGVGLFVFYGMHPTVFKSSDRIFPTFIVHEMPHGIAGLLIAAILAAAMSNLSAALNSLASTTVIDFWVPFRAWKQKKSLGGNSTSDSTQNTLVSRLATVFWAIVLFAIAVYSIQVGGKGHVVEIALSIASVAYGCLLGVFLLGTLTRYTTQGAAIAAMLCGFVLNLWLWQGTFPVHLGPLTIPHIAFTWYVLIGALVTFALGTLFSIPFRQKRAAIATLLLLSFSVSSVALPLRPLCSSFACSWEPQAPDFTPVSALITQAIAEKKLPGAVLLVGHDDKIVFEHAYGNRSLEPAIEPMTEDTIFDMASLSKVIVTTTAILQLYEQHKLDLDAPVAKYLPEFASTTGCSPNAVPAQNLVILSGAKDPCISPSSDPALKQAAEYKSKITIRELLTHYSGLPEDIYLKDDWGLQAPDKAEGIRRAMASIPYGPPGQTFKYSDINFITLGALVEKLSSESLDLYAQQNIFAPLGMTRTRYLPLAKACGLIHILGAAVVYSDLPEDEECGPGTWSGELISSIAPTAHDDEGTATTNPDFDHILRGTVHDPTTRRMGGVAGHAGVFSTAHDMSLFCQALLDKLLHNTGPFPLSQATLQLATGPNEPETAVNTATIFTPTGETTKGVASRGLGWDLNSPFSRPRGAIFPIATAGHPGSFGHTGFTGTSLWLDPTSDTYVILLANAIHPHVGANISPLRSAVATAVAKALGLGAEQSWVPHPRDGSIVPRVGIGAADLPRDSTLPQIQRGSLDRSSAVKVPGAKAPSGEDAAMSGLKPGPISEAKTKPESSSAPPQLGIDVLESTQFEVLKTLAAQHQNHLRIGLLANQSSLDSAGHRTIDILAHAPPEIELKTLFAPEHGLLAHQDTDHLTTEQDPATHIPVVTVYGPKPADKHPKLADLKQLDAVVIDLQDAGVRFWTYETLTGYFLEACAQAKIPVVVLDRPNPVVGVAVGGPTSDPDTENYTNFMPIPSRHGLTLGELARYFNAQATAVDLKPELLDARSVTLGDPSADLKPPATQPGLHANLIVVPMRHWSRAEFWADTQLPWTPPSPNLKSPTAAILYPGVAFAEQTNVSVGRGTATPFEELGAPWLDANQLAAYLTARKIPGVAITPAQMTVAEDANHYPYHGQAIPAIHFAVTNPSALDSPELGVELLAALHNLYPAQFKLALAKNLLANAQTLALLQSGADPREIAAKWQPGIEAFEEARKAYLLY
jgi:SSS family transporter